MNKLLLLALLASSTAYANPRALPFTYTTDTLAPGNAELEQTVDLVPLIGSTPLGTRSYYLGSVFQTELEIGIAERLELALYFTFQPTISSDIIVQGQAKLPDGNGIKQRLRYTFAPPGEWPVDVGVYGELSESESELELEGKILLQKRFDRLRIAANLWAEYELYFARDEMGNHQRDVVLNPTLGATYELSPRFHVGLDSWLRGEYPTNPSPPSRTFGLGPEYYVGPAIMMSFEKVWWTVAAYGRVTDTAHELQPGEPFGKFWFRTMVGYDL
jgi:hypothetical protein